jgi:AcrR family transcriptional regulator
MVRPSNNLDQLLLDAGLALLPVTGCSGLSVRRLTEHAGVNLGMFHYHFKNKDNFIRAVLQRVYEEMFAELVLRVSQAHSPLENLRDALKVLAHFGRKNRLLLARIIADAIAGDRVPAQFLKTNLPRHIKVIATLVNDAQLAGSIVKDPLPELIAFLAGAVGAPILLGGALQPDMIGTEAAAAIERHVLSDQAISRRIELALRGLST